MEKIEVILKETWIDGARTGDEKQYPELFIKKQIDKLSTLSTEDMLLTDEERETAISNVINAYVKDCDAYRTRTQFKKVSHPKSREWYIVNAIAKAQLAKLQPVILENKTLKEKVEELEKERLRVEEYCADQLEMANKNLIDSLTEARKQGRDSVIKWVDSHVGGFLKGTAWENFKKEVSNEK